MRIFTGCASVLCLALMSHAASSQVLTPDEINTLFNLQVEVQKQPLTRSLNGQQTRGLSLITVDDVTAEAVDFPPVTSNAQTLTAIDANTETSPDLPAASSAATSVAAAQTLAPVSTTVDGTDVTGVTDPNKPLVYAKLAPELQINLQIKFSFDSAALDQAEKDKLSTMCTAMGSSPIEHFRIIGHTDTSGSDAYNARLSVLRAKEVARHLVQECGINASRLETVGMGERFPVNATDPRAEENRRVEFQAMS